MPSPETRRTSKTGRGGVRPGAGRKAGPAEARMRSVPLVLTCAQINHLDAAARLAGRSRSSTLRQILDRELRTSTDSAGPPASASGEVRRVGGLSRTPDIPLARSSRKSQKCAVVKATQVYHLKITLLGVSPRIWRRLHVLGDTRLSELHDILQITMGWKNYHLHRFDIGGAIAGNTPDGGSESAALEEVIPPTRPMAFVPLGRSALMEYDHRFTFYYAYDMGDFWEHEIVVEKVTSPSGGLSYPRCAAGSQVGPPEDCGGAEAYMARLRRRRRKPPAFDCGAVNTALAKAQKARSGTP